MKNKKTQTKKKNISPSSVIEEKIMSLGDWRSEVLMQMRSLIIQVEPDVIEELKWRGVPVWSHDGIVCTGESYKDKVKLTFAKGAKLKDPKKLFNSSLDGNIRRAIDIYEEDKVSSVAFKALVREALALNKSSRRQK